MFTFEVLSTRASENVEGDDYVTCKYVNEETVHMPISCNFVKIGRYSGVLVISRKIQAAIPI